MGKQQSNINLKELMRPNTKIDKTDNIKLGEIGIQALKELINRWREYETLTDISAMLKTTRQTCTNWDKGEAKTFSQERLERLSSSLEVEANLIKRFMIGEISLDELWEKTKYQKNTQKDSTFTQTHDKIETKNDKNTFESSDSNAIIPEDLQDIISILVQLENPIFDKNMIVEALIGYIKKLDMSKRLELLEKIPSIIPEEQRPLSLPIDYLSEIGQVSFTLPREIEGAREIINLSYRKILERENSNPQKALDWFRNSGVSLRLLEVFFNEDKDATYLCGEKWDAKDLSLLTNNIFRFLKTEKRDEQYFAYIDFNKTYVDNFSRFFYDAHKIFGKQTIASEMINECMDKKELTEAKIQPLIRSLGISPQRWHLLQGGNDKIRPEEINAVIAVVDINCDHYSRETWLSQVEITKPTSVTESPKNNEFLVSSKFLELVEQL